MLSHVWLYATPRAIAHQAPVSMAFSRHEYWSGLPCPAPGYLPNPGIELASLTSPALAGGFFTISATCAIHMNILCLYTITCVQKHTHRYNMHVYTDTWASPVAQWWRNCLPVQEIQQMWVQFPGSGRSLGEENSNPQQQHRYLHMDIYTFTYKLLFSH